MAANTVTGAQRASLVLVGVLLCAPVSVSSREYFVDASGGWDAANGMTPTTAWRTLARVETASFQPGDVIALKRGEVWRERLIVPSGGAAGNPIVFTAYGTGVMPTISGADSTCGWQVVRGFVYRTALAIEPYQLFLGDRRLTRHWGAGSTLADGEWDWSGSFLYLNIGGNPSGSEVEATRGDWSGEHGVIVKDKHYVTLDGLHITRFRVNVFVSGDTVGSNWFTLVNCRLSDAYYHGIQGWDQTYPNNDVTISGNEVVNSGGSGINWTKFGEGGVISHNTVTDNCRLTDEETGSGEHTYSAGIYLFGNRLGISNIVIEHNVVQGCGTGLIPGDFAGAGIWVDQTLGGNVVRYNVVSNNTNSGIVAEDTPLGGMIYYNLIYENGKGVQPLDGYGLFLSRDSQHWQVYNNTVYDNRVGLCVADWLDDGPPQNNVFTNNIVYANESTELMVLHGSEKLVNIFTFNNLNTGNNFVKWGNASFDDLSSWQTAAANNALSNIAVDPLFVHPEGGDFRLTDDSACVHAGTDVGISMDIAGAEVSDDPSIGAYEVPVPVTPPRRPSGRRTP